MGVTITLGVRGSGVEIADTPLSEEPRESGAGFSELLSGGDLDAGSWSSGTSFDGRPSLDSRPTPPEGDESSYAARERAEMERDVERPDARTGSAATPTTRDPIEQRLERNPRAAASPRPRSAEARRASESHPSKRAETGPAERAPARSEQDSSEKGSTVQPPENRESEGSAADGARSPEKAAAPVAGGPVSNASAPPKTVARTTASTVPVTPEGANASGLHTDLESAEAEVEAPHERAGGVDLSGTDSTAADTTEGAASADGPKVVAEAPDADSAPAEPEPGEVASTDGGDELTGEVVEQVETSDDAPRMERELLAPRPPATSAPVVRASEIAGIAEARPELALASANGATTTTTASDAAFRVVETTASADVGSGGANGSGGSGSAGHDDASASARTTVAVSGAGSAPATSTRGAFPPASVFPEGGDAAPSWVERIAERIRLARSSERIELRLALVPKGLGQIDVRLRLDAEGLHATIVAEHEQTRALLAGQQHRLEAALAQEELDLSSFDLGVDDGGAQEEAPRGERREGGQGALAEGAATESDEPQAAANVTSTIPGRLSFWA